ncbi:MAG: fumarylacetoacetate hydrolase family protein [Ectothiorhodospiraceae bacterium]
MQYVTIHDDGIQRWGVAEADTIHLAPQELGWPTSLAAVLDQGDPAAAAMLADRLVSGAGEQRSLSRAEIIAPVPRPRRNIMCLGLNYADHARESFKAKGKAMELPEHPVVFTKATTSVTGPYSAIPLDPEVTEQLDWEVELAAVIGRGGRRIPEAQALDYVFGYTVINDLSARDLQFRHKQFFLGKSLDDGCPMGPGIVPATAIEDPQDLALWCEVNGERQQNGHTSDQLFGVAATIARLSAIMILEPGDIIATGTPAGVGFAQEPPRFLKPGDVVVCGVEGVGTLRNSIVETDLTG